MVVGAQRPGEGNGETGGVGSPTASADGDDEVFGDLATGMSEGFGDVGANVGVVGVNIVVEGAGLSASVDLEGSEAGGGIGREVAFWGIAETLDWIEGDFVPEE